AVFPDCAKDDNVPFCGRPPSAEEQKYAQHNENHGHYHYTDVPLQKSAYVPNTAGTGRTDVVQMIEYAVTQLQGKVPPEKKGVQLTNTEALWLLAHLVGDIHQPLHVGAIYFKGDCETIADPNVDHSVAKTVGGNLIKLTAPAPAPDLHVYWDGASVVEAM